jgi:two-component system, chemotaxis family, protein-glutamate methylesterase/glutaminase
VATPEQDHEDAQKPPVERVRVLVVDDSALMRRLLTDLLGSAAEIEVVGTARDGRDAVLQATRLRPDVITLDVEMPEASGIDALPLLLGIGGLEVVMVSALTQEGADVTLHALELGAFDFLPKPEKNQLSELRANRDLLVGKVLAAASSGRRKGQKDRRLATKATARLHRGDTPAAIRPRPAPGAPGASHTSKSVSAGIQCVVIGISTGGPQALSGIFPDLHPPLPPIIVVQHMPAQFTGVFAQRLNRYTTLTVKQAEEGDPVLPDHVLVAPGGKHLRLKGTPPHVHVELSGDPPVSGHRPSVDVLFHSAAKVYQGAAVGILMTGMGRDGVDGCKAILAVGGFTIGQDEESSAVYGMNKAAFTEGAVKAQFALDELAGIIKNIGSVRAAIEANGPSARPPDHPQQPRADQERE